MAVNNTGKKILERDVEEYLVKRVAQHGGIAYKFAPPTIPGKSFGRVGIPDRLCVMPDGICLFIECKAPGEKPSPKQLKEQQRLIDLHQPVFNVDSFESVDRTIGTWRMISEDCAQND